MRAGSGRAVNGACALMRGACCVLLAGLVLIFLWVSGSRLFYPYAVEWMEEVVFTDSVRIASGLPLYPDPESGFAAGVYNPLYQYAVALLVKAFGPMMGLARALSLASILAAALLVYSIIRRETDDRSAGFVGASFLIASFPVVGYWYDLGRIDSLWICTMLAGAYFVRRRPLTAAGVGASAACFVLSFFTKQITVYAIAIAFLYLCSVNRRYALAFVALVGALIAAGILLLQWVSDGWYWYYVFTLPRGFLGKGGWKYNFFYYTGSDIHMGLFYLVRYYPVFIAVALFPLVRRLAGARGVCVPGFWWALFAVFIVADGVNYAKSNAWHNSFYPTVAFTSVLAGLVWARLDGADGRRPAIALLFCICLFCQLVMLAYDPADHIPRPEDRAAGEKFIRFVSRLDGDVWLPHHPYYSYIAGKGFPYTAEASYLSYRLLGRLYNRFITAVSRREYEYIIIDTEPGWVFWNSIPPLTAELNENYAVKCRYDFGPAVFPKAPDHRQDWDLPGKRYAFMPVEGAQFRPHVILVPRAREAPRPAEPAP